METTWTDPTATITSQQADAAWQAVAGVPPAVPPAPLPPPTPPPAQPAGPPPSPRTHETRNEPPAWMEAGLRNHLESRIQSGGKRISAMPSRPMAYSPLTPPAAMPPPGPPPAGPPPAGPRGRLATWAPPHTDRCVWGSAQGASDLCDTDRYFHPRTAAAPPATRLPAETAPRLKNGRWVAGETAARRDRKLAGHHQMVAEGKADLEAQLAADRRCVLVPACSSQGQPRWVVAGRSRGVPN